MTERSRFWGGTATGDATVAPYDAETEFAQVMMSIAGARQITTNLSLVFRDDLNELVITGSGSPVSVASGRGLVYGTWYENDAAVGVAIATPAASTRIDRIVVRKSWAAQTVRITLITGVEGGGAPALVQVAGTTWDMPLYQASITTGGVITLTDERDILSSRAHGVRVHRTTAQSIPNNTSTAVQWDGEEFDTDGYHTGSGTTLVVPPGLGGLYVITTNLAFDINVTGAREFLIVSGGSSPPTIASTDKDGSATSPATASLSCVEQLDAGQSVEVYVKQVSGAPLDLLPGSTQPVNFGMIRIGN